MNKKGLSDLEEQGLIKAFEYTYELAWKTLQDYMKYQGYQSLGGPRNILIEAFNMGLITNGDAWSEMLKSRNLTSHSYNEETANRISQNVRNVFYDEFVALQIKFENI